MNTKMKIEKFNAVPDTKIYGHLGQVGYNLRDAISELVDNSIDARIPGKKLKIDLELDEFSKEVSIKDNGKGIIQKVNNRGKIILLTIKLDDSNKIITKTLNSERMTIEGKD